MVDFRINVVVDPSRVGPGTRVVEQKLTRVNNKADQLRRTLGLTFSALAGGAIIFGAVRSIAKFEESIATARAVTKATSEEFALLSNRAKELGITTRFSATQAADALVLLARAGFSVDEALTAVGDTLLLAQAGGIGLAEAADITANALRGFNLEADQTKRVTDVLVETTNNANSNVSELGQALKFVAPVANGLNQSIERTSAALGVLADAGLKATLGGTGLRRVLAELESPGRELTAILNEAGLAARDVAPSQNELVDILERLKQAGIDTGDALEVFGQRGGPAFQVLVSNTDKLRALNEQIEKSGDAAKNVANILDNTLNGALFRAKSAIEGLVLGFGEAGASEFLVTALDAISSAARFAARNTDLLQVAMLVLGTGAAVKLSAVLLTKLVPSLAATSGGVVGLSRAMFLLGTSVRKLGLFFTASPLGPFLVIVTSITFAIRQMTKEFEYAAATLRQVEEDAKAVSGEASILTNRMRELNEINRAVAKQQERGIEASDGQRAAIARLTAQITGQKDGIREAADAQRELNEREERGAEIVENLIARLERRNTIAAALGEQQKNLVAYQEELNKLEDLGGVANDGEKERIRTLLEQNDALARQQSIYDDIKGPQQEFAQNQAALSALLERNAITAGEYAVKLQELKDAQAPSDVEQTTTALDSLRVENQLLNARNRLGEELANQLELEYQLRQQGVEITDEIREQIAAELALKAKLTEQQRELNDAKKQAEQDAQREQRNIERLAQRIDVEARLAEQIELVNKAKAQGLITDEQALIALQDLQLRGLEASTALEDGFTRAFLKISKEADDLAAVAEKIVNVFADQATDALVEFATTGKFAFKEFATAILDDIIRIIARLLVLQAIQAVTGTGGGGAGGGIASIAGARENGGTVQPSRSFVVGENGPELFVPDRTGTIVPNEKSVQQAPAPVNVQVVNVQSEDDIPNAINEGAADDAIINAIARNKDRVNQVTS